MTASLKAGLMTVVSIGVIGLLLGGMIAPVVTADTLAQQTPPETDNTVTRIEVSENGSARWTIQIRTRLDTDEQVDEYTAFQARFRNDTARYLDPFRERMQGVVSNAANATGREMRVTNFTATTHIQEVPRRWGIVTYKFTWTNFAAQTSGTLVVGDVFQGGWFIAANDTLQIKAPTNYEITHVDPEAASRDEGVVTWDGRKDFADKRPHVVFTPSANQEATTAGPDTSTQTSSTPEVGTPFGKSNLGVVLGIVGFSIVGLLAFTVYRRRDSRGDPDQPVTADAEKNPTTETPAATDHETPSEDSASTTAVMTDEERVLNLLDVNGGRMRQTAIAEEFDWSASKTSRVVGKLADEGEVEKLQLGRENLVALPNHDE